MNRRVLHVDDQADFRDGVRQLLGQRFEVHSAASGAEALALCERHGPFAVVISDYGMPGMSGIELLAELATQWPDTLRILLTGSADPGLALEALDRGAIHRFLTKPPLAPRLLEAVAAGVERFRNVEEERQLTEQLAFARESLQALNQALDRRLDHALAHLGTLADGAEQLARAGTSAEVLECTTASVRALLGVNAASVQLAEGEGGLEILPAEGLSAGERRSLAILACAARGALGSAQLRSRVREAQHATLQALERMAREHDDQTGAHLARVSAYARLLCEGLRADGHYLDELDDAFIEDVAQAAPLHDIGKVAIPDSILFKPGKLDEREWEIMRTHAAVGAEILRGVHGGAESSALLERAREIAWTHHERWDGGGYPRGLARTAIPLAGRILAVADCYDALTSERPYKPAWPHRAAATHLEEQRGRAFDPALVDVFLAREPQFQAILSACRDGVRA